MKRFAVIAGSALMGLTLASGANAANPEQVTAEVTFVAAITIVENESLQVGLLDVAMALNDTVTINTDDTFSESASNVVGGNQRAALLTITATGNTGISILADNVLGATYYTLGSWLCSYDSGADTACGSADPTFNVTSAAGGSATLDVGVTLTGLGGAVAGNDDATFDITVAYQ
jgi:opacity protein-like surface antigen